MRLIDVEAKVAEALTLTDFPELERIYTVESVPSVVYLVIEGEVVSLSLEAHGAPASGEYIPKGKE
jgi:hypothetical protein